MAPACKHGFHSFHTTTQDRFCSIQLKRTKQTTDNHGKERQTP